MPPIIQYVRRSDIVHQAIQTWLRLYVAGIYEYHTTISLWPSHTDDLSQTSLPRKSRYWKQMMDKHTVIIVWHKNLKPDPKDNAGLNTGRSYQGTLRPTSSCLGLLGRFCETSTPETRLSGQITRQR